MRRTTTLLALVLACATCYVYALWSVAEKGTWPGSWPKELEPLRGQSRTLEGSQLNLTVYEIPFTSREDFESAWPHILKVKSKGAPLLLLRGPDARLGTVMKAGARIQCPPDRAGLIQPSGPYDPAKEGERPIWRTFLELVVDGDIVDLNRIHLPADTPIIDKRFRGD